MFNFIPEDGTGLENANSLCDLEFADNYFLMRGINRWFDLEEQEKHIALIQGTDYARTAWEFKGWPMTDVQALPFPRVSIYGHNPGFPNDISKAVAEYAIRSLDGPLYHDPVYDPNGRVVVSESKKLKGMEKSVSYSDKTESIIEKRKYPAADRLLAPYVKSGNVKTIDR